MRVRHKNVLSQSPTGRIFSSPSSGFKLTCDEKFLARTDCAKWSTASADDWISIGGHRSGRHSSNWSMHRPVADLIMFIFSCVFSADQGPVIGRDGRRGLCGPKAPIRDRPSYHHGDTFDGSAIRTSMKSTSRQTTDSIRW